MDCLCLNTRRAARALTTLYEQHLRPCNLTAAQFGLLSILAEHPGLSQQEIATAASLDQTTLSRNLQRLNAARWIERTRSATDRRQTLYVITPIGRTLQREAKHHWANAQKQMSKRLGPDLESAIALLSRLANLADA